jgi:hypothetical protein
VLKVESVDLQPLVALLLELLREANRQAGRRAGEQPLDDYARRHAGQEAIKRIDANATDESEAFVIWRICRSKHLANPRNKASGESAEQKNGGGRRRSATPPNDSPTGVEIDLA